MKTFQKIALVSAIAAAPFAAQAELVSMDDALMGDTTGQAGVTIDMKIEGAGIQVGSVVYTDEGSLKINSISLTGSNAAGDANQEITLSQTVDVLANGDLQLVVTPEGGEQYLQIGVGSVDLVRQSTAGVDAVAAAAESSELINNLDMTVKLTGASTTTIHNVDIATQTLGDFAVTGSASTETAGLVISQNAAFQITDLNVGVFGYTTTQGAQISGKAGIDAGYVAGTTADDVTDVTVGSDFAAFEAASGDNDGKVDAAELAAYATYVAGKSAIGITGLTLDNDGGAINMNQKIWADSKGVNIQIAAFNADLNITSIAIGGASIGSLAVNDISMAGLTQTIYGH
jgi:hypothetical protein